MWKRWYFCPNLKTKKYINIELHTDELDLTSSESKATYAQIKQYVLEKYGLKVSSLDIAQTNKNAVLKKEKITIFRKMKKHDSLNGHKKKKKQSKTHSSIFR